MDTPQREPRRQLSLGWRLARGILLVYLGALLMLSFLERSLVFFPLRYPQGMWETGELAVEDAWFHSADGTKLHGWYLDHDEPRAHLLFAHGNAGNLSHRQQTLRNLHQLGVAVLMFDYRGYGHSEGTPHEAGILQDARAARAWLARRAGIPEREIVLLGESLGGGVMVDLAASDGARGLVLENTFTSLPDVAAFHYPWVPARWLMRNRLDSLSKISRYEGPLLQTHGDADTVIPYQLGEQLFAAATGPKTFVRVPGGDHNDPPAAEYLTALDAFLDQLPPPEKSPAAPPATADLSPWQAE